MSKELLDALFTKTSAKAGAVAGFDKVSAEEKRGFDRGKSEGRREMLHELEANLDKVSSNLVAAHRSEELQRQGELAKLSGSARVLAMAAETVRIKTAAAQGLCWRCKTSSCDDRSPYLRCQHCDSQEGIHY